MLAFDADALLRGQRRSCHLVHSRDESGFDLWQPPRVETAIRQRFQNGQAHKSRPVE